LSEVELSIKSESDPARRDGGNWLRTARPFAVMGEQPYGSQLPAEVHPDRYFSYCS